MAAQFFVMSEVASNLFHENPTVFGKVRLHLKTLLLHCVGHRSHQWAAGHPPMLPKCGGI